MEEKPNVPVEQTKASVYVEEKKGNLLLGIITGIIAALIGAVIWALITFWTGWQIGWMAVGVGFLVGISIRIFGKGTSPVFGVIGAILALLGCLAGNLLATCIFLADELEMGVFEIISKLDFKLIGEILKETFAWQDILFYAIAIYEGYKFSFRKA
jgi:hypothetical protein